MKPWTAAKDIGPIQASKFNKAWSRAGSAFSAWTTDSGFVVHIIDIGYGRSKAEEDALSSVGDKFSWTLDRSNIAAATKALGEVYAARMANCPPESDAPCGCNRLPAHMKKEHVKEPS